MESSLNSSSPEPSVPGLKSIFNKQGNFYQAFEVSLDESTTAAKSNRSEVDLDITSAPNKALPFKKSRKSLQQPFNVDSGESFVDSESEQSVTFTKPQSVFTKKKNKSIVDFFNVSYNETVGSLQGDAFSKSIDESNIVSKKKNPFKKTNESQNDISIEDETLNLRNSEEANNKSHLEESQQLSEHSFDRDEADSTTFVTKENPFKTSTNQNNSVPQLSVSNGDKTITNTTTDIRNHNITNNSRGADDDDDGDSSIVKTKINPFKQVCDHNSDSMTSMTEERSVNISNENAVLMDARDLSNGLDPTVSKLNNNTSCLEQSSVNDDNLNNWMSDQSDDEMPAPRVPSLTANLSHTKEKPTVSSPPPAETNPSSVWEQKFNEIMSNVKKKNQTAKRKENENSLQKPNPLKKFDANIGKPPETENKYKQPKLMKPAPFATKKLYEYIIKKLEPKYGINSVLESQNLVVSICDTVKKVTRRKSHQKRLIQQLKKEMAEVGLIQTTMDFYEFVIKFLPYSFRVKVVPCLQPITNVVYPPKDVLNPFDKIL